MNGNDVPRSFNMTFSELMSVTKKLNVALERDLADLSIFGLTQANIDNLADLVDDFENMPTDIEYEGDVMLKTQERDEIAEQVKEQLRFMSVRVEAAYGANSLEYDIFRFGDFNKLPDDALLTTIQRIARTANKNIAVLGAFGVTPALITQLEALATQFSDAIVEQENAVDARRRAANTRTIKANEIYTFVTTYSNFGKKFYAKSNPANYEDYIIYSSSSPGTLAAPQNLVFNYGSKVLWWDAVDNAVSYQLQWFDGSDYVEIYSGSDDHFAYTPADGLNKFRVRAHNAGGYGPWSDELLQYYFAVLPKAANLQVVQSGTIPTEGELTWDAVPTAFNYKVYQSVDNIGEYAAHWLVIGTVTEPLKAVALTLGKRNSFKVETNNTYQTSMSDPVYIEV